MGKTFDTQIDDGRVTFTFTNTDGELIASFKMNPTDVNLVQRCEEVGNFFTEASAEMSKVHTGADVIALNKRIEEKFDYMLGYEAHKTLFSNLTATTILPSGEIFAIVVLDRIRAGIEPEIQARKDKMKSAMEKYTGNYE